MDIQPHSPTSSSTSSSTHPNNTTHSSSTDPIHSWWETISKARSRINLLISLLPPPSPSSSPLSSLSDTDRPARSLLLSSSAYSSLSHSLSSPSSGSPSDPICQWLYDTYLSSGDPDLRLVVLSYIPLLTSIYLQRIHHPLDNSTVSLAGFEAVLLALYSSETKSRNGKPVVISIPDLSQPSLYHSPRSTTATKSSNNIKAAANQNAKQQPSVGVVVAPLEPQMAVKSTKRACIVGVALDCYYKQISQMPSWSKRDFCEFVTVWAGESCPCDSELDHKDFVVENGFGDHDGIEDVEERVKYLEIEDGDGDEGEKGGRIPLPWELLQPVLRILGHCLLGPLNGDEVKDAASVAVRRLYARATHDLVPQAILATRSLIQLDKGAREAGALVSVSVSAPGSNVNTPSKGKKPEILLVSK